MTTETWLMAGVAVTALAVLAWQLGRPRPRPDDAALVLLQQQLDALRTQLAQALTGQQQVLTQQIGELTGRVNERLRESVETIQRSQQSVGERLDSTTRVVTDVQRGLGELAQATKNIYDVGKDVASLHDILRAPKLRGGLGEFFLGDLLAQVLPPSHFTLQHGFRSGERVDAVVRLGGGLVPVDAKFPLEDFRRLLAATDDDERTRSRKAFAQRVRKHVDDVAGKYILPDEGTYDFALLYVPAENVYYETIIRDEESGGDGSLAAYALERRVIPVSPGCFYAYLQAIVLGLRGLKIEDRAREVIAQLARLSGDLGRCRDDFRVLGKHLSNAAQTHATVDRRLERLGTKLATIAGGEEDGEPVEQQPPLLRLQS
jgi:DNA recombination protein RmuC